MKKYNLIIELLSDLCVADGGVYNSLLDTDVCHDEYGPTEYVLRFQRYVTL